jgi:hypothetical protein
MLEGKIFSFNLSKKFNVSCWFNFRKICFGIGSEYSWKGFIWKIKSIFFIDFLFFHLWVNYFGKEGK